MFSQRESEKDEYGMKPREERPTDFKIVSSGAKKCGNRSRDDFETVMIKKHNTDETSRENKNPDITTPSSTYAALIPRKVNPNAYEVVKPKAVPVPSDKREKDSDISFAHDSDSAATGDKNHSKKVMTCIVIVGVCFGIFLALLFLISCVVIVYQQKNTEAKLESRILALEHMIATASAQIGTINISITAANIDLKSKLPLLSAEQDSIRQDFRTNNTLLRDNLSALSMNIEETFATLRSNDVSTENRLTRFESSLNSSSRAIQLQLSRNNDVHAEVDALANRLNSTLAQNVTLYQECRDEVVDSCTVNQGNTSWYYCSTMPMSTRINVSNGRACVHKDIDVRIGRVTSFGIWQIQFTFLVIMFHYIRPRSHSITKSHFFLVLWHCLSVENFGRHTQFIEAKPHTRNSAGV